MSNKILAILLILFVIIALRNHEFSIGRIAIWNALQNARVDE